MRRPMVRHPRTMLPVTTTITVHAVSSNPTKASSPDYDTAVYWRIGKFMRLKWYYRTDNASGGAAGSGVYKILVPGGLSIDTNYAVISQPTAITNFGGTPLGKFGYSTKTGSNQHGIGEVVGWSSIYLAAIITQFVIGTDSVLWTSALGFDDLIGVSLDCMIPIAEWQEHGDFHG